MERQPLVGGETEAGVALGQFGEGDRRFEAGEVGAEAEVDALAEGDVMP